MFPVAIWLHFFRVEIKYSRNGHFDLMKFLSHYCPNFEKSWLSSFYNLNYTVQINGVQSVWFNFCIRRFMHDNLNDLPRRVQQSLLGLAQESSQSNGPLILFSNSIVQPKVVSWFCQSCFFNSFGPLFCLILPLLFVEYKPCCNAFLIFMKPKGHINLIN